MVRDRVADEDTPDLQAVLDALDDPKCRRILERLTEPMTAEEISRTCDVPLSTTYRKLDRLTEAALVREGMEVRADGQHASTYDVDFEEVVVALDEDRTFDVEIGHLARDPDERLVDLWSEVRKET